MNYSENLDIKALIQFNMKRKKNENDETFLARINKKIRL